AEGRARARAGSRSVGSWRSRCRPSRTTPLFQSTLPDVDALLGRQIALVAGLAVERLVPGVDVTDDPVHPIFARAVLVGDNLLSLGVLALLLLPRLSERDEKALVAGQAVDYRRLAVLGGVLLVRRIGRLHAGQVADVFAKRQLAVDGEIRERLESVILRHKRVGLRREGLGRVRAPPVAQLALRVELAAFVVEAVAHLVADHRAD